MKRATIKDVAKLAGVSTAAVSYVINGKMERVSEETMERIKSVIETLNYIPDFSARSLSKNESKLIGVVIPQTEEHKQLLFENPFYSEIVSGIEWKLRQHGYHLILSGIDKGQGYLDITMQRNLDGAIIMGVYKENFYDELKKINIPIVLIDSYINDSYFTRIGIDDEYGGYLATKHLIEHGHTNIGLITGSIKKEGVIEKRFMGYKRAIREANLFYNPDYVFEDSMSYEHGYSTGMLIAEQFPEITAVFACADMVAYGVVRGLMERGKRIPDDVSIIGFDDIFMSKMFIPPLTTIKQDITMKGFVAAEQLLRIIENGRTDGASEIVLPLELVERNSVRKL